MTQLRSISSTHAAIGFTVQGSGTPLVLLHSSMSSKAQWHSLAERMSKRYRVIAIDLYGYGEVPMPAEVGDHRLLTEVARVKAVLQQVLAPGERFHLAGHSFGGAVALRLAHARRNWVLSLSLFEPTAFHLIPRDARALEEVAQIAHVVKQGLADGQWLAAARSFIDFWNGRGAFDRFSPGRQAQFAAQLRKTDLDFDALLSDPHTARDYAAIACPMLLMLSRGHRECTRAVASELARHHTSCLVHFVEGGHMAPLSHSDLVNDEIDAFTSLVDEHGLRATA